MKIEEGEIIEDAVDASKGDDSNKEATPWGGNAENQNNRKTSNWARRDGANRAFKVVQFEIFIMDLESK